MVGNGIINADGELWKVQRKAGLNFLNNANLKILTDVALPAYLDETVKGLSKTEQGSVIDLEDVLHELTTQLMGRMAYGVSKWRGLTNVSPVLASDGYTDGHSQFGPLFTSFRLCFWCHRAAISEPVVADQ